MGSEGNAGPLRVDSPVEEKVHFSSPHVHHSLKHLLIQKEQVSEVSRFFKSQDFHGRVIPKSENTVLSFYHSWTPGTGWHGFLTVRMPHI